MLSKSAHESPSLPDLVRLTAVHRQHTPHIPKLHIWGKNRAAIPVLVELLYVALRPSAAPYDGHGLLRSRRGFTFLTSLEEVHDHCKATNEHHWFVRY